MANIFTNWQLWMRGLLGAHASSTENVDDQLAAVRELTVDYTKAAADAMASTTTAADYFYAAARDVQIISAKFVSPSTAATNGTNFGTIIVNKHDGAGGAATVAASADTSALSIAAGVPFALTLSATLANVQISAGQVLSFQITKAASGVVIPAGYVVLQVRYI